MLTGEGKGETNTNSLVVNEELMYHAMHTGEDYGGTKTNILEVNSTNFLDVYDELFKVLWIESFIVFVLTSVHQVKGR